MGSYLDDPSLNDTPRDQINMERNLVKVCQNCWGDIRPDEYFPNTLIAGTCNACGNTTFVARIRRDEIPEVAFSDENEMDFPDPDLSREMESPNENYRSFPNA